MAEIAPVELSGAASLSILAPGLTDLQVNGYGGVDFQQADLSEAALTAAVHALQRDGCTRFLLTLVTAPWEGMLAQLSRLRRLRAESPLLTHAIAGWHVEGPFLSRKPGYCGAHHSEFMRDPTPAAMRELRDAAGDAPLLVTLAPELPDAMATIRCATSLGIRISLGHTDAAIETLLVAAQAGASAFTHLGNGCPQNLDRHDNILWRVLETPSLLVGLIPDGIHVSRSLFRFLHRALDPGRIFYTTDAMAAAGAPPGCYQLGPLKLEVAADGVVRHPGRSNFAGSSLRPIEGVFRAAELTGAGWPESWFRFSEMPASWMHLAGGLAIGAPADICVLEECPGERPRLRRVFAHGMEANVN